MSEGSGKTIKDWMGGFQVLYGNPDQNRTPGQIWIATMAHCSSIGEAIRRFNFQVLLDSAAHTFCWICSFVNRCNNPQKDDLFSYKGCLSDMVSAKYPNVCGHCMESSSCKCRPKDMDKIEDKPALYRKLYDEHKKSFRYENKTISDWQKMFDRIYGQQIHVQSFETVGFHFLEEVGECAKAIRSLEQLRSVVNGDIAIAREFINKLTDYESLLNEYEKYSRNYKIPKPGEDNFKEFYKSRDPEYIKSRIVHAKMDMIIEIADTFSWFCSILNKANDITRNIHEKPSPLCLEEKLEEKYIKDGKFRCPTCEEEKCCCTFFSKP